MVWNLFPAGFTSDVLVYRVAQPRHDHRVEARAIQTAHQVAQADDGAAVADPVLDVEHALARRCQRRIQARVGARHRTDVVALQGKFPCSFSHGTAGWRQALPQGVAERSDVALRIGQPRLPLDDQLSRSTDLRRHTRQAAGHRFEHHVGQALLHRRQNEHVGAPVVTGDVGAELVQCEMGRVLAGRLAQIREQLSTVVLARLRSGGQQQCPGAEPLVGDPLLGQPADVLAQVKDAQVQGDRSVLRQLQCSPQGLHLRSLRRVEAVRVHAIGQAVNALALHAAAFELRRKIGADRDAGIGLAQHRLVQDPDAGLLEVLQIVLRQTGLDHRLQAQPVRQRGDERVGEVGAVAVQDVEIAPALPHVSRQVEPEPELPVLAQPPRFDALDTKPLDHRGLAQAGPSIGHELDMVPALPQLLGQGQRLQRRTAVFRLEVGREHQDAGRSGSGGGCDAVALGADHRMLSFFSSQAPSSIRAQTRNARRVSPAMNCAAYRCTCS